MFEVRETVVFREWLDGLRDRRAAIRISARVDRLSLGNLGDVKSVGDGVSELRIDHGPGYRLYFTRIGQLIIVLLCGGDKSTQTRDIRDATIIARRLTP